MASNAEQLLAQSVRNRPDTDYRFAWGTYIGWTILTMGIYSHYATYRLVQRRAEHARRRLAFSSYLWQVLAERADAADKRDLVQPGLDNLSRVHAEIESFERRNKREPGLWTILRVVFTVVGAYINHFLNKDFRFLETWEVALAENAEWVMQRLEIGGPIAKPAHRTPDRSTWLYVLLTVLTAGLFSIWWRSVIMKDGNEHFDAEERSEDAILAALGIAPQTMTPAPPQPPL
ncbi:MAG TPA: hypothetical protein VM841_10610 [Actinomycetota bacterium]|nr:hypothetical protein [Actinomycetota bacterium]